MKKEMITGTRKALAGLTIRTPEDPLTALDIALADIEDKGPPRPGEFTIEQFQEQAQAKGHALNHSSALKMLQAKVNAGQLKMRKGPRNLNIYHAP